MERPGGGRAGGAPLRPQRSSGSAVQVCVCVRAGLRDVRRSASSCRPPGKKKRKKKWKKKKGKKEKEDPPARFVHGVLVKLLGSFVVEAFETTRSNEWGRASQKGALNRERCAPAKRERPRSSRPARLRAARAGTAVTESRRPHFARSSPARPDRGARRPVGTAGRAPRRSTRLRGLSLPSARPGAGAPGPQPPALRARCGNSPWG